MFRLFLVLLFLAGCAPTLPPKPDTSWKKTSWENNPGIVSLATGWGKANLCTGVVLAPRMVLSAAHCSLHEDDTLIVYGCNDIRSSICKRVGVEKIIKHPDYKIKYETGNDIAIFIAKEDIDLPNIELSTKNHYEGDIVKAVGFGKRGKFSGIMYEGSGYIKSEFFYEFNVMLKKLMDPNPGDSGGPALVMENGEYKLLGVLSRVKLDRNRDMSYSNSGIAVYTRAKPYETWIKENTPL